MTALKWIVTEAKKLKKQYPKRFATWREYVAQASAIYASKHKGKTPVGKKHKKSVGAIKKVASKKATPKSYHKDTKSHNVNIRVVSGLSKIVGVPHKAKYYIDYMLNGYKKIEYFDKMPKGYYKGQDKILYLTRFTDSGTTLIPIVNFKTQKIVRK